ncbi:MAG: hypothetical protein Q8N02_07735 [Methylotenera sp.]|nr:hypothetical protein [Methylotenera sp.]MDO9233938.1 hypothetical protein [Methylotenera sp.]MDO9388868.1 hypothetical protein [Methylotenera sp.]MDP2102702.1 hypothetical protein [Methylotenera sp.]MDP2282342.1 hypothetical protein [Methylotenera sp.]
MRYKLPIAVLVSVLIHVFLIANLNLAINTNFTKQNIDTELAKPSLRKNNVLQVGFLILSPPKLLRLERELALTEHSQYLENANNNDDINASAKISHENQIKPLKKKLELPVIKVAQNQLGSSNDSLLNHYLKPSDVDITAIPVYGIEPPIQTSTNKLLVVYQLRIFIDKNGSVDEIVNLDISNSEQIFYAEIEARVKKLVFIPAKKNGVEVNSYIDIALEA